MAFPGGLPLLNNDGSLWSGRSEEMSVKAAQLKTQHAPKARHEDPVLHESTPARPLRILAEYINPLAQLKREGIGDTIVLFGSARIHSREDALAKLEHLRKLKVGRSAKARAH